MSIPEIRKERKLSQQKVAEYLNTTQQQIYKYENGIQEIPTSRFIKLADLYNVSLDDLAGRYFPAQIGTLEQKF